MAFDNYLAERINAYFEQKKLPTIEKRMMGGLCFMLDDKMCVGVVKDQLMARIGEVAYADAMKKEGCHPMDFTGRPMKGYVFVEASAIDRDEDLAHWLDLAIAFNPEARSSKKK